MRFNSFLAPARMFCVILLSAMLLTACGGGGGGSSAVDPLPDVPNNGDFTDPIFTISPNDFDLVTDKYLYRIVSEYGLDDILIGAYWAHWAKCTIGCSGVDSSEYLRGNGATIAIVDTGVDINHNDLEPNIILPDAERPVRRETHLQEDSSSILGPGFLASENFTVERSDDTEYALDIVYGGDVTVYVTQGALTLTRESTETEIIITAGTSYTIEESTFGNNYFGPLGGVSPNGLHGTHVAGIAAGAFDDIEKPHTRGIVGVAPEAKILPLIILDGDNAPRILDLEQSYSYAAANNVFVANNSWGYTSYHVKISVDEPLDTFGAVTVNNGEEVWIDIPAYHQFRTEIGDSIFAVPRTGTEESSLINQHAGDDMLIVFAQGNDGWNSETGQVAFYHEDCFQAGNASSATASCSEDQTGYVPLGSVYIDHYDLSTFTVYGYRARGTSNPYNEDAGTPAVISDGENLGDSISAAPARDHSLDIVDRWINVVAVDPLRTIASFSNGCGETKDFCLAAPGVNIESSIPGENSETGRLNGTSMAAPHVSGLAALLKGAFPNLTPEQAQDIILYSADGLGSCADVARTEYCVDDVYGHGMMNVYAAFAPLNNNFTTDYNGFNQVAMGQKGENDNPSTGDPIDLPTRGENARIANSSIGLSPAFGPAAWRSTQINIGLFDEYGRLFHSRLNLNDGFVVGAPTIDSDNNITGIHAHAAFGSPLHNSTARFGYNRLADGVLNDHDTVIASTENFSFSRSYYGNYIAYNTAYELDSGNTLAWQHHSGDSVYIPAAARASEFYKPAFVREERNNLQYTHSRGDNTQFAVLYENGGSTQHLATRLSYGYGQNNWGVFAEGGVVHEEDTVLGATFSGIFKTEQAATRYQRIGVNYRLAGAFDAVGDMHFYADYLQAQTQANETGGIVQSYESDSDSFSSGLSFGGWDLSYTQPLAITNGSWQWQYKNDYDSVANTNIDLTAAKRERIYSLHYTGDSHYQQNELRYSFGVDYINHAAAKSYRGDLINLSAAVKARF